MAGRMRVVILVITISLIAVGFSQPVGEASSAILSAAATIAAVQECAKCSEVCKSWDDQCKQGDAYACFKAAACHCKCNLDAGGCGSSKKKLRACYKENEKLAKQLRSAANKKTNS